MRFHVMSKSAQVVIKYTVTVVSHDGSIPDSLDDVLDGDNELHECTDVRREIFRENVGNVRNLKLVK